MKDWNVQEIAEMLMECGKIALKFYENPPFEYKKDHSVVTIADKMIENYLSTFFDKPEDGSYLIGEETSAERDEKYISNALKSTAWIIDPIDGTAPYSNHIPLWGTSIGFMQNGKILEGSIYMPVSGEIFITDKNKVYYASGINPHDKFEVSKLAIMPEKKHEINEAGIISISQRISKEGQYSGYNPVLTLSCCVYSTTYLFLGRILAYFGTVKLWDIAAALAMAEKLGFEGILVSGEKLGTDVSERLYHLDAASKHRWGLKNNFILAKNQAAIDYVLSNYTKK